MATIAQTELSELRLLSRGKVRDIYDHAGNLLIVTTDRISAFDVVLPTPIPDKGRVLTQLSAFWFGITESVVENHLITTDVGDMGLPADVDLDELEGRSMLVKKAQPLPVECVARGYIIGSGWVDYQATGEVCGIKLPSGLRQADRLEETIFTPATKAQTGHDENIDFDRAASILGRDIAERVRDLTLELYAIGHDHARSRGIILADTKYEFGMGRRPDRPHRRGDDSRFVPVLGHRDLRSRHLAAELRQAVRARLSDRLGLEQGAAAARSARLCRQQHFPQIPRCPGTTDELRVSRKTYEISVVIRPLAEVVDPEGETIHAGLRDLGYAGVSKVRAGKLIELDIEAADENEAAALTKEMSERLLANPVIEQYEISVREMGRAPA